MTRDVPKEDREGKLPEDLAGQFPAPQKDEAKPAKPDGDQTKVDAADSTADVAPEPVSDVTPDFPADDSVGEEPLPDDTASPPLEPTDPESLADIAADESNSAGVEPVGEPAPATPDPGWSNFVPAPGYADPQTGRPRFLTGRIDQAGLELSDFVLGRRPVFEPELAQPGTDWPPPPPPFVNWGGGDRPPPSFPQANFAAGATAPVFVDVRVGLSPEAIEQISKGAIRKAAEFSRGETMVVARKLHELINELKDLEQQRRIAWGRY